MRKENYWNLFWQTGMPEAWMMSRPTEGYLFPAEPAAKDIRDRRDDLPREARQLEQNQTEQAALESAKRPDRIG